MVEPEKSLYGSDEADDFYAMMDRYFASFDRAGAILVLTADHGMNAKTDGAGEPKVVYLQDELDRWLGKGQARVILPITDPYVGHHGALGSYGTVYLPESIDRTAAIERLSKLPGIELVLRELNSAEQVDALRAGLLDAGFAHAPPVPAGLGGLEYLAEPFVCCLPAGHPPAQRRARGIQAPSSRRSAPP